MTSSMIRKVGWLTCVWLCGFSAMPAAAQVLEIGADGVVTRFDGPAVFTSDSVRALAATAADNPPPDSSAVRRQISSIAETYALDPRLVDAVAWRESRFHPEARSARGAIGVMQLMPETARALGVNPLDVSQNIHGGARYLRRMLAEFGGDVRLALAAYNAGPEAVRRYGGVPPYAETKAYVAAILGRMATSGASVAAPILGASN